MSDSDAFLWALGNLEPDEARVREAARRIAEALVGFSGVEGVLALCFHLHGFIRDAPPEVRAGFLAGFMRLIDPAKGEA